MSHKRNGVSWVVTSSNHLCSLWYVHFNFVDYFVSTRFCNLTQNFSCVLTNKQDEPQERWAVKGGRPPVITFAAFDVLIWTFGLLFPQILQSGPIISLVHWPTGDEYQERWLSKEAWQAVFTSAASDVLILTVTIVIFPQGAAIWALHICLVYLPTAKWASREMRCQEW